jgi:pilus assembly protein FimV
MKIAVRRILLLGALMSPTALYALGLGDIRLKSALNQPFDAEIQLVDATAEDLAALRASVASNDTFVRYGLDRPAYLSEFTFTVAESAGGQAVLRVSSSRPVTEPFVTFLIDATWPRGRLLREYTVLLDPPVYAPGPAVAEAPVAAPRASTPAPSPTPAESYAPPPPPPAAPAREVAPREAAAPAPAATTEAASSYRVQPNDTLWKIASGAYPGTRADVNRAMLAIYQANPQAFDGNINVLRAGSELAIPDAASVGQITASEAAAEVARQYREWRAAAGEDASGRLRLVTPEQGSAAASTAVPSAPASGGREAAQLQARVQQLEAELAEARRLLEVRNAELASLQGQAAQAAPEPKPAPPETQPAGEPVAVAPEDLGPAVEEPPVAEPVPAPVAEETAPKPAAKPAAAPAPAQSEPTLLEQLLRYWWAIGALILVLLALFFIRRRRLESAPADTFDEVFAAREAGDLRERPVPPAPRREAEILVEERRPVEAAPSRLPRATPAAAAAAEPASKPVSPDDTISTDAGVSIEAGDPLAEADFHMAYGLYDQAADLVRLAIKREPQRRDLKLKLLEIFFVWGNRERFMEVAHEIRPDRAKLSASEWDKVLIMGKQIAPEDPMFTQAEGAAATSVDMELSAAPATDLDFLADAPEGTATDLDMPGASEGRTGSTGIDFVLDEPLRGVDLGSLAPTVESAALDQMSGDATEEVALESLGLEVEGLSDLEDAEDMLAPSSPVQVEDTVERPMGAAQFDDTVERPGRPPQMEDTVERPMRPTRLDDTVERPMRPTRLEDTVERPGVARAATPADEDEEDTLNQTGVMRSPTTTLKITKPGDSGIVPLLDPTGEVPTIDETHIQPGLARGDVDFVLGDEPATMSEVGTKLDLARAYIDMGDPEGARSILEEVLQEGSNTQKQEAQRLMSGLP